MRIRVSENGKSLNVELPLEDAQLAWQMKRLGNKNGNMCCTLETAWENTALYGGLWGRA